jgi:RHS repeat-associated protein
VFGYDNPAIGANGIGRLTSASDANHSLSWTYDDLGRINGKGQTAAGITKSVGYAYNSGDLVSLVTPSGQKIVYAYTNHQITSITVNSTSLLSGVTYFPYGAASAWTWSNGTGVARTYDQDGKISTITTAADTLNFGYDNAFRITGITDTGASANSWSLPTYDLSDRLESASKTGTSYGFTYDANGNRLTQTGTTAITLTPATASNELTTTTGGLVRTYSYDASGDTKSYGTLTLTFNDRGRMSVAINGTTSTTYIYNALGQLIEKTVGSTKTLLVYDETGHLLGEYTSTGALIQETVWMGDVPVATLRPNGSTGCTTTTVCVFYVHTDQLNAPRKNTNSTNALVWRWDTDPFGTATPNQNPTGVGTFVYNLRFPGQYYQAETGLNYNYARDYDPSTGRYIESDPIGLNGGSFSTYAYVDGNPISGNDPLGLFDWPSIPDPLYNFSLGIADNLSFGIGPLLRSEYNISGPNRCSKAYKYGEYSSFLAGSGRLLYAGSAAALSLAAVNGAEAVAARNLLKRVARGPLYALDYRIYSYEQLLAEKGTDAAVQAAAGRTNNLLNALGFDAAAGGDANSATSCGCN